MTKYKYGEIAHWIWSGTNKNCFIIRFKKTKNENDCINITWLEFI